MRCLRPFVVALSEATVAGYPLSPCVAGAAGGKAAKAAAKAAAKQDKRNAKLKEQRAAEAAAGAKKRVSELKVGQRALCYEAAVLE